MQCYHTGLPLIHMLNISLLTFALWAALHLACSTGLPRHRLTELQAWLCILNRKQCFGLSATDGAGSHKVLRDGLTTWWFHPLYGESMVQLRGGTMDMRVPSLCLIYPFGGNTHFLSGLLLEVIGGIVKIRLSLRSIDRGAACLNDTVFKRGKYRLTT